MDFKQFLNKKLYDFDGKLVMNDGPAGDKAFQNEDLYYIGKKAFELVGEDPHTQNSNLAYNVNRGMLCITVVANNDIINRNKIDQFHSPFNSIDEFFDHIVEKVKEIAESVDGQTYLMDVEVKDIMSFDEQRKEEMIITIVKEDVAKEFDAAYNTDPMEWENSIDVKTGANK